LTPPPRARYAQKARRKQIGTGKNAMNEPPVREQTREADDSVLKYGTWPQGTPALRIGNIHEDEPAPPVSPSPPLPTPVSTRAPWYLRLLRLAVGLTLLVLAWCGVLVIDLLVDSALHSIRTDHVALDTAIAVLKIAGACWVAIATIASIVAGAFSLLLALTNRDWR
jgi:hypothetical protein